MASYCGAGGGPMVMLICADAGERIEGATIAPDSAVVASKARNERVNIVPPERHGPCVNACTHYVAVDAFVPASIKFFRLYRASSRTMTPATLTTIPSNPITGSRSSRRKKKLITTAISGKTATSGATTVIEPSPSAA